ncbi:MAG: PHP domain-containing protein [Deltaproteobacteria bacterium]|jgi:hypothetical protein|nr:PHP domain-containing protein [Deltaproteobacteria bacterium]
MWRRLRWIPILAALLASSARAQDPDLVFTGEVPPGTETHFFVPFEVPEDIVEIEVRHDDLSSANILDWGLDDPNGFRGWGGGNSEPAIVGEQAASRSYVPGPMPAGTWEVVVGKARIDELPAMYRIEIFLRAAATLPAQPRTPYQDPGVLDEEARWYAGDFHVHTRQSGDADPTIEEVLDYARVVGLDFVMLSEHNTNSGLTLYGSVQSDYPDVLIVPGVEWTTYSGHANAIGAVEWVDHKTGVRGTTVKGAIEEYQDQGAVFYPTHPTEDVGSLCIGCLWEYDVDPEKLGGSEVWTAQGWTGSVEYWEGLCAQGSHAVAIGGSDDHDGGAPGPPNTRPIGTPTTMVFAENLSVSAILEGVKAGRTVVKVRGIDSPMLETELTGERVGDTVFANTATLSVLVTGGEGETLLVFKNDDAPTRVPIDSDPFTYEQEVVAPPEGEDRYRHQVGEANAIKTIGSYVWLRAPSSGCDCRVASASDSDTAFLLLFAGTLAYWWRSRRRST